MLLMLLSVTYGMVDIFIAHTQVKSQVVGFAFQSSWRYAA